jgi:hypothetical protein
MGRNDRINAAADRDQHGFRATGAQDFGQGIGYRGHEWVKWIRTSGHGSGSSPEPAIQFVGRDSNEGRFSVRRFIGLFALEQLVDQCPHFFWIHPRTQRDGASVRQGSGEILSTVHTLGQRIIPHLAKHLLQHRTFVPGTDFGGDPTNQDRTPAQRFQVESHGSQIGSDLPKQGMVCRRKIHGLRKKQLLGQTETIP